MLKASAFQEIWPSPSQIGRPCTGQIFIHPATENNPALTYDTYGYCTPGMTAAIVPTTSGMPWGTILLVAGVAIGGYYLYRNRKRIFA